MPNVYVINRSGHDFHEAERYGKLIYLSEGSMSRYATARIYRQFAEILKHSKEDDFILTTGLSVMNCIATSIMTALHGKINLLLFKDGKYVCRTIAIHELLNKEPEHDS